MGYYSKEYYTKLESVRTVRCPRCRAVGGERCRYSDGNPMVKVHPERSALWANKEST